LLDAVVSMAVPTVTIRNLGGLMRTIRRLCLLLLAGIAGCASSPTPRAAESFDVAQIRAAERRVIAALTSEDVTAWVNEYTEDAVLLEPSAPPVAGRAALLALARTMKPIASGSIRSDHIEGSGDTAYSYGIAEWVNGRTPGATTTTRVRQILAWRKESDGVWRIAMEAFLPLDAAK
jgi:ketosteroid isomerase-like protein